MDNTIIIYRTGQAPLRIRGKVIARNASSDNSSCCDFSGSTGRWQEVKVYETASGKYIVSIKNLTRWQGENDTNEAAVFSSVKEAANYISNRVSGWMHQELIEQLGEEVVAEDID